MHVPAARLQYSPHQHRHPSTTHTPPHPPFPPAGLHALGPHFSQLVASQASANLRNLPMLARLLEATAAMAANRAVDLGPYLAQLMPPVMTCLLARTLGATPSEDHWGLRQQAAQLLATLCAHYRCVLLCVRAVVIGFVRA